MLIHNQRGKKSKLKRGGSLRYLCHLGDWNLRWKHLLCTFLFPWEFENRKHPSMCSSLNVFKSTYNVCIDTRSVPSGLFYILLYNTWFEWLHTIPDRDWLMQRESTIYKVEYKHCTLKIEFKRIVFNITQTLVNLHPFHSVIFRSKVFNITQRFCNYFLFQADTKKLLNWIDHKLRQPVCYEGEV